MRRRRFWLDGISTGSVITGPLALRRKHNGRERDGWRTHSRLRNDSRSWCCRKRLGWERFRHYKQHSVLVISGGQFATLSLTASAGFTLSLSDIGAYNIRRSGSGPATGIWHVLVGGGAFYGYRGNRPIWARLRLRPETRRPRLIFQASLLYRTSPLELLWSCAW